MLLSTQAINWVWCLTKAEQILVSPPKTQIFWGPYSIILKTKWGHFPASKTVGAWSRIPSSAEVKDVLISTVGFIRRGLKKDKDIRLNQTHTSPKSSYSFQLRYKLQFGTNFKKGKRQKTSRAKRKHLPLYCLDFHTEYWLVMILSIFHDRSFELQHKFCNSRICGA